MYEGELEKKKKKNSSSCGLSVSLTKELLNLQDQTDERLKKLYGKYSSEF